VSHTRLEQAWLSGLIQRFAERGVRISAADSFRTFAHPNPAPAQRDWSVSFQRFGSAIERLDLRLERL